MIAVERIIRKALGEPEIIGPKECPLIHRWELFGSDVKEPCERCGGLGFHFHGIDSSQGGPLPCERCEGKRVQKVQKPVKLILHHFLPNSHDRDPHDHPRPFWTFVLAGEYVDESMADNPWSVLSSKTADVRERMRPGMLRFRRARHTHRTWTGNRGCWTLVLMGPVERDWGFWRNKVFWFYKPYKERFGDGMDCA